MKMPSTGELNTAIAWLRSNNGNEGESERCEAVAAWIEHEEFERLLRNTARAHGLPIAAVRRRIAQNKLTQEANNV